MLARDIMTRDVVTSTIHMNLSQVGTLFMQKRISGMPVLGDDNRILGIITMTDLFRILSRLYGKMDLGKQIHITHLKKIFREKLVVEFMSTPVHTVREDADISEIISIMLDKHVHTIPVVDRNGFVVGIIGKHDIDKVFFA